jgi:uncharacterized protein YegJ (DUF2314 family)
VGAQPLFALSDRNRSNLIAPFNVVRFGTSSTNAVSKDPPVIASASRLLCIVAAGVAVPSHTGCSRSQPPSDPTIFVEGDDAEMQAAVKKARSELPAFWKKFDAPAANESSFSLKVEITDANGTEFFWVLPIEKSKGKIFGTINNEPDTVKSVALGDRIEIREEKVIDWLFVRNKKMVGNYTLRPLMKRMSKDEADRVRLMLEDP